MYDSQSSKALKITVIQITRDKFETNVWQLILPSLTLIQIRDKCIAASQSTQGRYCHTNKRQMHDSQFTLALLSYK